MSDYMEGSGGGSPGLPSDIECPGTCTRCGGEGVGFFGNVCGGCGGSGVISPPAVRPYDPDDWKCSWGPEPDYT
jgi:hypothetical protein